MTIASFIESTEKEISANSELAQSLLVQASGAVSRSLQEQVEGLMAKERENASKLKGMEGIQNEMMAIVEEQQCLLEEAQLKLLTPKTFEWSLNQRQRIMVGLNPKQLKGLQSGLHR